MLVNDRKEIGTKECRLSSFLYGCRLKDLKESVFVSLNLSISDREEDGFHNNSEVMDTHISDIEEGLKPWSML